MGHDGAALALCICVRCGLQASGNAGITKTLKPSAVRVLQRARLCFRDGVCRAAPYNFSRFSNQSLWAAAAGHNGLLDPVEPGLACGSDTAHLSILGYDPRQCAPSVLLCAAEEDWAPMAEGSLPQASAKIS